jgi:anti-anti-sigma regulatory factor
MVAGTIIVDCAQLELPSAGTIDGIARLQLAARRHGRRVRLENPSRSLLALIDLCGLAGVLGVEAGRQAEEGENSGGVQKEGDVRDPTP